MGAFVAVVGSDVEAGVNGAEDGPRGVVWEDVVTRLCEGEVVDGMDALGDDGPGVVELMSAEADALAAVSVVGREDAVESSVAEELEGLALVLESWVAVAGAVVDGIVITLVTETCDKLRGGVWQATNNETRAMV